MSVLEGREEEGKEEGEEGGREEGEREREGGRREGGGREGGREGGRKEGEREGGRVREWLWFLTSRNEIGGCAALERAHSVLSPALIAQTEGP